MKITPPAAHAASCRIWSWAADRAGSHRARRQAVGTGEDAEHAGHRLGARGFDAENAGMRVRGAHHHRIGLTLDREIIAEPAAARGQPLVFLADDVACR